MHSWPLLRSLLFRLDAERAHGLVLGALSRGLGPEQHAPDPPALAVTAFGRRLPNPLGLAAGFDKDAAVPDAMLRLGFGFVECGSVTPLPQSGNPQPRLFRSAEAQAVVNRMGFNNSGLEAFARNLAAARGRSGGTGCIGINLGRNKDQADAIADYALGARRLAAHADYLVVNVSSPNTPGLRALQDPAALRDLLAAVLAARGAAKTPVLVKLAPDLEPQDIEDIARLALDSGIDGAILTNTTIARPDGLPPALAAESGGLSGRPLFARATTVLARFHRATEGRLLLLGAGGVASGADAFAKIAAGASLVQLYSALVFHGPGLIARIKAELAEELRRAGFASVQDAVGHDAERWAAGGPSA